MQWLEEITQCDCKSQAFVPDFSIIALQNNLTSMFFVLTMQACRQHDALTSDVIELGVDGNTGRPAEEGQGKAPLGLVALWCFPEEVTKIIILVGCRRMLKNICLWDHTQS